MDGLSPNADRNHQAALTFFLGREEKLLKFFESCTRSKQEAEDLLSLTRDGFVAAAEGANVSSETWNKLLGKIARNVRAEFFRQSYRQEQRVSYIEELLPEDYIKFERPVEDEVIKQERRDLLYEAISHLAKIDQAILALRINGFDDNEIAEIISSSSHRQAKIAVKTVQNRISLAKRQLRVLIEGLSKL